LIQDTESQKYVPFKDYIANNVDNNRIIVSATEPVNPVAGMIW
jgi:hypothetical protein